MYSRRRGGNHRGLAGLSGDGSGSMYNSGWIVLFCEKGGFSLWKMGYIISEDVDIHNKSTPLHSKDGERGG